MRSAGTPEPGGIRKVYGPGKVAVKRRSVPTPVHKSCLRPIVVNNAVIQRLIVQRPSIQSWDA
jgi:hypothetical protein